MSIDADDASAAGPPLGEPVDPTPARRPGPVTVDGRFGKVARLDPRRHAASLWDVVKDHDDLWTYMPYGPFTGFSEFSYWLGTRVTLQDPCCYAILDRRDRALGLAALMEIRPAMRVIEVGHIVLSPALQRTALATEAQYLLARYAFETLKFRRYEWKCDAFNDVSRQAALRLGFTFEGVFRDHMIVKGRSRDTAWFAMLASEWPARKAGFERWLAVGNFHADGRQKTKLADVFARP